MYFKKEEQTQARVFSFLGLRQNISLIDYFNFIFWSQFCQFTSFQSSFFFYMVPVHLILFPLF